MHLVPLLSVLKDGICFPNIGTEIPNILLINFRIAWSNLLKSKVNTLNGPCRHNSCEVLIYSFFCIGGEPLRPQAENNKDLDVTK